MRTVLNGRVAFRGRVQGSVRVINSYDELAAIQPYEIVVTAQTDINYVPYLLNCAGLITERGGRYCHAATYARENRLPCITSVEGARRILRTGDRVCLDADNNTIELIAPTPNAELQRSEALLA